jgi:hypothetical protein
MKNIISICLTAGLGILSAQCGTSSRRPSRFLLPQGYVGWVQVDFGVKGAAPVKTEEGFYLFKFPADGRIATSSQIEFGKAPNEYYYYADGWRQKLSLGEEARGGTIWAHTIGATEDRNNNSRNNFERFFVGSESEFRSAESGPTAEPLIGPIQKTS